MGIKLVVLLFSDISFVICCYGEVASPIRRVSFILWIQPVSKYYLVKL